VDIFYGKDIILKNINYKFSKGNIYILKGENGTGKSSLINAIIGIRKNYKGKILLNNINVENLNMYYLRKNTIKVVEQEPFILEETIENILKSNSYSEMFFNTLNFLNLNELVKKIKTTNNIQNVILNLSGGQKQKLSISIALANSPSLLVLDEPTSALDTDSVSKLKELLANNIKNKIIIIICHNDKFDDISTEIIHLDYYKNKDNEDQKM
jgi:ATP-binding cassette subfamily C protein